MYFIIPPADVTSCSLIIIFNGFSVALFPGLPTVQFLICNNGGRRPGILYHVNEVSVYLGRQRGGGIPHRKNAFCTHAFCFEPEAIRFSLHERSKLQRLGQKLRDKTSSSHQARSFDGGILTPFCLYTYIGKHWHHSRDKTYQAFPLRFCILQAIKNWTVGRPGNEASFSVGFRINEEKVICYHLELGK